jgi:hypothetical protein
VSRRAGRSISAGAWAWRSSPRRSGKVEEVEQVRPGTNFTKIPPQNVARLKGIIEHYKGMAHPFTACVRDQIKHGLSRTTRSAAAPS